MKLYIILVILISSASALTDCNKWHIRSGCVSQQSCVWKASICQISEQKIQEKVKEGLDKKLETAEQNREKDSFDSTLEEVAHATGETVRLVTPKNFVKLVVGVVLWTGVVILVLISGCFIKIFKKWVDSFVAVCGEKLDERKHQAQLRRASWELGQSQQTVLHKIK